MLELYNLVLILGFKLSTVWPVKWDIVKAFLGSVKYFILVFKYSASMRCCKQSFFGDGKLLRPSQAI